MRRADRPPRAAHDDRPYRAAAGLRPAASLCIPLHPASSFTGDGLRPRRGRRRQTCRHPPRATPDTIAQCNHPTSPARQPRHLHPVSPACLGPSPSRLRDHHSSHCSVAPPLFSSLQAVHYAFIRALHSHQGRAFPSWSPVRPARSPSLPLPGDHHSATSQHGSTQLQKLPQACSSTARRSRRVQRPWRLAACAARRGQR